MSDTPKTDVLREVIISQYKEDECTGNGMGKLLAALTDIESLERERDKALEECAKWHGMAIEAYKRFVESVLFAAAPEMLDALRRLTHPMASDEDLTHALAVIAKVEGGDA